MELYIFYFADFNTDIDVDYDGILNDNIFFPLLFYFILCKSVILTSTYPYDICILIFIYYPLIAYNIYLLLYPFYVKS
jgi:hypothetical protein